jgi:hypothetical protein
VQASGESVLARGIGEGGVPAHSYRTALARGGKRRNAASSGCHSGRACLALRGGSLHVEERDEGTHHRSVRDEGTHQRSKEATKPLQSAGVGAALSVNEDGQVVFSQMVDGMPAANSGAIKVGDALVRDVCSYDAE